MTKCKTVKGVERAYRKQMKEICGIVDREDYEQFCAAYERFAEDNNIKEMHVFDLDEIKDDEEFGKALINGDWKVVYMSGRYCSTYFCFDE